MINCLCKIRLLLIFTNIVCFFAYTQQIPDINYKWAITTSLMSEIAYQNENLKEAAEYYLSDWEWSHHTDISGLNWTEFFRTLENGKKEIVISFEGTNPNDYRDVLTDISQAARLMPIPVTQYEKALEIGKEYVSLADKYKNTSVIFTGHSLGGGVAQYVSIITGTRAYVFNSAPLGLSSRWDFNLFQREQLANNNIINIRLKGDLVSITPGLQAGQLIEMDPIGNLSIIDKHLMPSLYNSLNKNKSDFINQSHNHDNYNRHPLEQPMSQLEEYRDISGLMKDFETIYNELVTPGNSNLSKTNVFKNTKNSLDIIMSYNNDLQNANSIDDWSRGEFAQKLSEMGLDKLINIMKKEAATALNINKMPTFGMDEVFQATREEFISGNTNIDILTRYLDATVGLTWGILGYTQTMLTTGNHQAAMTNASTLEQTGKALASIGRFGVEKAIQKYGADKIGKKAEIFEMFHVANLTRIHNGHNLRKLSEMFNRDDLRNLGFNDNEIDNEDINVEHQNIHLESSKLSRSLNNMSQEPTVLKMSIDQLREIDQFDNRALIVGTQSELQKLNTLNNQYRFIMQKSDDLQRDILNATRENFNVLIYLEDSDIRNPEYLYNPLNIEIPNLPAGEAGVSMKMNIDEESYKNDNPDDLNELKNNILNNKSPDNKLFWTTDGKKNE